MLFNVGREIIRILKILFLLIIFSEILVKYFIYYIFVDVIYVLYNLMFVVS